MKRRRILKRCDKTIYQSWRLAGIALVSSASRAMHDCYKLIFRWRFSLRPRLMNGISVFFRASNVQTILYVNHNSSQKLLNRLSYFHKNRRNFNGTNWIRVEVINFPFQIFQSVRMQIQCLSLLHWLSDSSFCSIVDFSRKNVFIQFVSEPTKS